MKPTKKLPINQKLGLLNYFWKVNKFGYNLNYFQKINRVFFKDLFRISRIDCLPKHIFKDSMKSFLNPIHIYFKANYNVCIYVKKEMEKNF